MASSLLPRLLQLRMVVGFLGERNQFAWWPTTFFDTTSRSFLEPVFVKTTAQARYHGVVEAARRIHDERLSVGSFHLFRLPEEMEQDLFATVKWEAATGSNSMVPSSRDGALQTLHSLAGSIGSTPSEGPMLVGSIEDIDKPETIMAIAGTYLKSFIDGTQAFPYVVGKR